MRDVVAKERYLLRHIEPDLPAPPISSNLFPYWDHVLVVPAYRESAGLLQRLEELNAGDRKIIVILVINRPDSDLDAHANSELRSTVETLKLDKGVETTDNLLPLSNAVNLYIHDMERLRGPTDASEGVGLARKTGCDIAFKWITDGVINSPWIYCTDADATLPSDYFLRTEELPTNTAAALFPFTHNGSDNDPITLATSLYELRLHHYALGLQFAGSPYAFHTLGSCLLIRASAYAHCRGFPKRSGGEDFYLLNKLRKIGEVIQLGGQCIELIARESSRIPFGTGPAVTAIAAKTEPLDAEIFYHPTTFLALRAFLDSFPELYEKISLEESLSHRVLEEELIIASASALETLGLAKAAQNFRRQSKDVAQFNAHMLRWFDAFRTLKFLHALRDNGWPALSLARAFEYHPNLWPAGGTASLDAQELCELVYEDFGWQHKPL
jgi:hypothetical protein